MEGYKKPENIRKFIIVVFLTAHFIFFAFINRYHLIYQEQIHLFRFDFKYFTDIIKYPGGFIEYLGNFLIQFYFIPVLASFLITVAGFLIFKLTNRIIKDNKNEHIQWSLIPVLILVLLSFDPLFSIEFTIGLLIAISFFALYISIEKKYIRYTTGFIGWFLLYQAAGGFALLVSILIIFHELSGVKSRFSLVITCLYALTGIIVPYLAWITFFSVPLSEAWLSRIIISANTVTRTGALGLLIYYPVLLAALKLWSAFSEEGKRFGSRFHNKIVTGIITGILLIILFPSLKKLSAYQHRTETLFKIDNYIQREEWERALQVSSGYEQTDQLIVFLTNISLLKSGKLCDRMFYYNQTGPGGLYLDWVEDNVTPFFGCEIFYQLGYNNEAYRWAFEALIATGQSPRLLKRLVLTSFINNDTAIAEKYLNLLDQTLFYRSWSQHYRKYLFDPDLLKTDDEIIQKHRLLIHKDFFNDPENLDFNLVNLLDNHPENKPAFEYYTASLLLEKDLVKLVSNVNRLKKFEYKEIPVHYEEALLIYMVNTKSNAVPEGYSIRESTIKRFRNYLSTYSLYFGRSKTEAAEAMSKEYDNTYWFYSQFY